MSSATLVVDEDVDDFSVVVVADCSSDKIVKISVGILGASELICVIISGNSGTSTVISVVTDKLTDFSVRSTCIGVGVIPLVKVELLSESVEDISSVVTVKLTDISIKLFCVVVEVVPLVILGVFLSSSAVVETTVVVVGISLFCSF